MAHLRQVAAYLVQDFSDGDNFLSAFLQLTRIMCAYRGFGQQVPATNHVPERKMNSNIAKSVWSIVEGTYQTRCAPEGPEGHEGRR